MYMIPHRIAWRKRLALGVHIWLSTMSGALGSLQTKHYIWTSSIGVCQPLAIFDDGYDRMMVFRKSPWKSEKTTIPQPELRSSQMMHLWTFDSLSDLLRLREVE
jgi:hypothetical protein